MDILFCGGGTAGHVTPNLALIDEIFYRSANTPTGNNWLASAPATTLTSTATPTDGSHASDSETHDNRIGQTNTQQAATYERFVDCKTYYVGNTEQDRRLLLPYVDVGKVARYYSLDAPKLRRSFCASNFALPVRFIRAVKQAGKILDEACPDVVFSKGGYVGLPVVIAAHKRKIPVILHESDTSMGLANKLSLRYVTAALSAFVIPDVNTTVTGMILRKDITRGNKQRGLRFCGFDGKKPVLLVTGGSLGAQALNDAICQTPKLAEKFDIFVLTGKNKRIDCDFARQTEFCTCVNDLFAAADVCLTRGGSTTLCELTLCQTPFVVVPLVNGSRGEQLTNAKNFARNGCGILLNEADLPQKLYNAVCTCYEQRAALSAKQAKLSKKIYGTDKCLQVIADTAFEFCTNN